MESNGRASDVPRVITAQSFRLADESGTERGRFALEEGLPSFVLLDQNGVVRLRVHLGEGNCPRRRMLAPLAPNLRRL